MTASECVVDGCDRTVHGREMCQMHLMRWRRHGDPLVVGSRRPKNPQRNKPEDVWRYVQIGGADDCWPWTAGMGHRGYGVFCISTRTVRAHRMAFHVATGMDPGEQMVCHRCDNPPCCNPAHLFLGTGLDNVRDMLAKGRARPPNGSRHHAAKLTEDQVREIRSRRAAGEKLVDLAREFSIGDARLSVIVNHPKKAWRHVA